MTVGLSIPGLLVLDSGLRPLAFNTEALRLLSFPTKPETIRQAHTFLADKVRSKLVTRRSSESTEFAKSYVSGKRRYLCRAFQLSGNSTSSGKVPDGASFVLVLERHTSGALAFEETSQEFALTEREIETVQLLVQGLTSKEIAARMKISPNTVKAFLRLVMVKMGVSTRSGIAGKMFSSKR